MPNNIANTSHTWGTGSAGACCVSMKGLLART